MGGSWRLLSVAVVAVVLLGAGRVSAAETFRDTAHKYALDLPDGWEVVPSSDLPAVNAAYGSPRNPLKTITAFREVGTVGIPVKGKRPLVVVHLILFYRPEMTFEEFEKEFTRRFTLGVVGRLFLRAPLAFDEQRKRVIAQFNDEVIGEYSGGFLGKDEAIAVSGVVERRAFNDHLPTFEKVVDSFRFEDPNAPPAPPAPPSLLDRTFGPLGQTAQLAIVGGVVGVLVLVVGVFLMRRPPERRGPGF
jgi:hypothetical protein